MLLSYNTNSGPGLVDNLFQEKQCFLQLFIGRGEGEGEKLSGAINVPSIKGLTFYPLFCTD